MFPLLDAKANELIAADIPIESAFSDVEEQIRYWKIEGFGQVPCGGTHIRRTGELGSLRLQRDRQRKRNERIEIYLA
jgi:Ser-tRNA(Ala) deacylase AlaX